MTNRIGSEGQNPGRNRPFFSACKNDEGRWEVCTGKGRGLLPRPTVVSLTYGGRALAEPGVLLWKSLRGMKGVPQVCTDVQLMECPPPRLVLTVSLT